MLINMLRAVSKMLISTGGLVAVRVECAKTLLDEIIESMDKSQPTIQRIVTTDVAEEEIKKTAKIIDDMESGQLPEAEVKKQPRIVLDNDRKISAIENFPATGMIELDGKKMMAKDAIGKEFNEGKLL